MKILVIGGSGKIGSKVVSQLQALDHNVISGSSQSGINSYTGEGLAEAMQDTDIVIDLANSREYDEQSSLDFFQRSSHNLIKEEIKAGIKHHVTISIVGCDRMKNFGYMDAKLKQEEIVKNSGVPYTIVRCTQFFEFVPFIAMAGTKENEIYSPITDFQPIAAEDAAALLIQFALGRPVNGTIQIAGPECKPMSDFIQIYANSNAPEKKVVPTGKFEYFGIEIPKNGIVPLGNAYFGEIQFNDWLINQPKVTNSMA